ncbi:MFS transporter [Polymorphospora rubra]|nr:MFS transporter [Polymorphospora rubra]
MSDPARPTAGGVVAKRREASTLLAAALTNGPAELVDFVLPLWAGIALGASATEVGLLVALELAVSVVVRPIAGVLADTRERRYVAGAGALLYGLSCAGYAVAGSMPVAYLAAVLGGVGGALLWVAVRAIVGERLARDTTVYPRLMSAQETGTWVAFVAGLTLLGFVDFRGLFLACAAACLVGAVALFAMPARRAPAGEHGGADVAGAVGLGAVGRRLRPMLLAVVVTMTAEAAIGILLLLHLQRGFDLEVIEIAYVFLPGAIAMSVLPGYLHRFVLRFGRTRVLATASVASAAFAASLSLAPNPWVLAGLWVLSGAAWAAVMPIQQAVIAEASGAQTGRGMGLYESAALVGGVVGSLAGGLLYDGGSWALACLVAAVVILSGALIVPRSVRALGVADVPTVTEPDESDVDANGAATAGGGAVVAPAPGVVPVVPVATRPTEPVSLTRPEPSVPGPSADAPGGARSGGPPVPGATERSAAPEPATAGKPPKTPRQRLVELGQHAALFAAAQVGLAVFGVSWLWDLLTGRLSGLVMRGGVEHDGPAAIAYGVGRIWTIVLVVDVLWTLIQVSRSRRR